MKRLPSYDMVSVVPFGPQPSPCCDNSLYGSPAGPLPPPPATISRRFSCTLPRPPFSAHRRWRETLQPYPLCQTRPPSAPLFFYQPSRERRPSKERLCNRWFFSSRQTICSTPWGARSFQNGQIGALLTAKPAGPPRPGRKGVADRACAWFVNDEAARLGLDVPISLAKRLGTQLPGARETQARKQGLMTCSITIRCGMRSVWGT